MDFAVLPPEVNSWRMYAGAGAGPLVAAASAWDRLSAELNSAVGSYRSVVSELTDGSWRGPASASMTAAAEPYLAWMTGTAAQAAQTASQARAAATAYEQAFAATVPPSAIAANRASLNSLVASNFFGQNSAAIAANQTQYAEMWAQDATAMHSYAASSAAAATLPSFSEPPQTTNPAGTSAQASTTAQAGAAATSQGSNPLLAWLQSPQLQGSNPLLELLDSQLVQGYEQLADKFQYIVSGIGGAQFSFVEVLLGGPLLGSIGAVSAAMTYGSYMGAMPSLLPVTALPAVLSSSASEGASALALAGSYGSGAGLADGGVSADLGRAVPFGGLSAPPSLGATAPAIRLAATALPAAGLAGLPEAGVAAPGGFLGGIPPMGSVVNAPGDEASRERSASGSKTPSRIAAGGEPYDRSAFATNGRAVSSKRDEINRLRQAITEMTVKRDALKRSAASVIKKAAQR